MAALSDQIQEFVERLVVEVVRMRDSNGFPKGTDLTRWTAEEIDAVAHTLNTRPRKTLGWQTPAEALDEHLRSLQQTGVATTD